MAVAVALTHVLWPLLQYTPLILAFGATVLSAVLAGPKAGFLAVGFGLLGYARFALPLPSDSYTRLLVGFAMISGTFAWLVARHRETEAALRFSEARLSQAQELAHVGNWHWEIAGNRLWWSDELYRIFGVDPNSFQLSYPTFLQLIHPDDRRALESAVTKAMQDRQPYRVEHKVVRPDGTVRVVSGHGRVVVDERGEIVRMIGATQDITDRKTAEESLRRSERRLQTIIDAEPACVNLVSPEGTVLEVNRAGLEMLGAKHLPEVVGQSVVGFVHPEDRVVFLQTHRQVCEGAHAELDFRAIGLNQQERWVNGHFVPFEAFTEDGISYTAVLSVASDITARKRLEEQLRQSQKMEAVGLLAGGIAHDFNNLLTAISGYAEMVMDGLEDDDARRQDVLEICKAAERAAMLTKQLLAFSRRQLLHPKVLNVNLLVGEVQNLLRRTIGENIDLVLDLSPSDQLVCADRTQLEQVLLNLAVNARDAMPGGGQLRFTTGSVDADVDGASRFPAMTQGRYVRLAVSDTGIGISADVQARIFEPFFTTKDRGKGTGLGLATVYGIVKQSGGYIWVDSQVGRGTTFEIYLPAVEQSVEASQEPAQWRQAVGGSETILLAEDDGAVRRLAREILVRAGYTVLEARDGDEAVVTAQKHPGMVDLLITDVVMPGLGGPALAAKIATRYPKMRVLYTSGYATDVMLRQGIEHDLPFLSKPFLPADLVGSVREVLDAPNPRGA